MTHLEAVIEVIMSPNKLLSPPVTRTSVMILLYVVYAVVALYDIYLDNHDPYPRTEYEGFATVVFILGILLPMTLMSRDNPRIACIVRGCAWCKLIACLSVLRSSGTASIIGCCCTSTSPMALSAYVAFIPD